MAAVNIAKTSQVTPPTEKKTINPIGRGFLSKSNVNVPTQITLPTNFKLPPPRPNYDISKESLPFIPPEIEKFSNVITNLNVSQNKITEIFEGIGTLAKMTDLDVSYNNLKFIPSHLSSCAALKTLLVSGNPGVKFPSNLFEFSTLTTLSLQRNKMTALPKVICSLPNLQHIDISFNNLTKITSKIANLSKLCTLVASNNVLSSVPEELGKCTCLTYLDVKENKITHLPNSLSNLCKLEELWLSHNKLTEFPSQFKLSNFPSLYKLDAFHNSISELPETFFEGAEDSSFEELHMGRNNLEKLPLGLWSCNLILIDLKINYLKEIPTLIENLSQLAILDLCYNMIKEIPVELCSCNNLVTLNVSGNFIRELPHEITQLQMLRNLYVSHNQLASFAHFESTFFQDLEELVISENPILNISRSIGDNFPALKFLYLNNLGLTEVPSEIGDLGYLEQLDLSHNKLAKIPVEILQIRSLYSLDLSHNFLINSKGGDPESWDNMDWDDLTSIEFVDLCFNNLQRLPNVHTLIERGINVTYFGNPCAETRESLGLSLSNSKSSSSALISSISNTSWCNVGWSEMVGRRTSQEDALCIFGHVGSAPSSDGTSVSMYMYGLFDGHAGRAAAEFAAQNAVPTFIKKFSQNYKNPLKVLIETFETLNELFRNHSLKAKDLTVRQSGTTGILLLVMGKELYVANVGDTRAVLYKGGDPKDDLRPFSSCDPSNVVRLSEDHKPNTEEDRIREQGGYVIDSRVNGFLGVSRAIGDFYVEPVICKATGNKYTLPTDRDAFIIMACDGLWDQISDEEACSIAYSSKEKDPHKKSMLLRDASFLLGSDDNISVVFIQL